ncbi:uroporphyrinogen-III C-methyltransferase [Rhodoferax sp. WC2427]|uniref:uroporphyrinogen-III C-methyltransferase n=1 Tax=Rhodoferax sp. WC2427 TaxID=3234144 RepID=UPI0034672826
MNAELPPETSASPLPAVAPPAKGSGMLTLVAGGVAVLALVSSGMLWQKLSHIQEQLARQSADAGTQAVEARTIARQAQDQARDIAARQAVTDARVSETTLQRTQLEDLMQSLSRSRDENLVVDIESSVRLAQQQAQLTGSIEPLLAALKSADDRVTRAAQPRLAPLQRAIAHDTERIKAATTTDTPGLLVKLDELVRQVDDLPTVNAVVVASAVGAGKATPPLAAEWWQRALDVVHQEARKLLRVSRIEQPEAALLSPEQTFFLRENLKLKLLNARLGLLARQLASARTDLNAAAAALNKYFDPASRKTQTMATLLQDVQGQMKAVELPQVDETLAALATAAAGR